MVYDGYYGDFVPVDHASFDVSTTPEAIVELPWPEEQQERAKRPNRPALRCDACRQRRRSVERCRDGLLALCRACARGQHVAALDAAQAIEQVAAAAPLAEQSGLKRQLQSRLTIRQRRRDRKTDSG